MLKPEERRSRQFEADILGALRDVASALRSLLEERKQEQENRAAERRTAAAENEIFNSAEALRDITYRLDTLAEQRNTEQQQDKRRKFQGRSLTVQWCLFGATFLAFGAAAWYARVASEQKTTMEKQLTAMNNSFGEIQKQTGPITDSARAAKDAAKAAQKSSNVARDALTRGQRAFLSFGQTLEVIAIPDANRQHIISWEFKPVMINSGDTPTRNAVHQFNSTHTGTEVLPPNFQFPDAIEAMRSFFTVAPKDRKTGGDLRVDAALLNDIRAHTQHLYFWGWVTYRDVFDGTPTHVSMFCTELDEVREDATRVDIAMTTGWTQCSLHHNCNDEECDGERYDNGKIWHSRR